MTKKCNVSCLSGVRKEGKAVGAWREEREEREAREARNKKDERRVDAVDVGPVRPRKKE